MTLRCHAWHLLGLGLLALTWEVPIARAEPPSAIAVASDLVVADVVLKGGTLVDGTLSPRRQADVAVRGDRIVAVGSFEVSPSAKVIDATSLIVAPGFIDLHTHSDNGITQDENAAEPELPGTRCDHDRHGELWISERSDVAQILRRRLVHMAPAPT